MVYQDNSISFDELNRKSNQLARRLIKEGIGADDIVGIMVERSLEMIIGILGVLKSGGAYLPLLPGYPPERLRYIAGESHIRILLTQSRLVSNVDFDGEIIPIDDTSIYEGDASNPDMFIDPSSLAYVIYTSGSTGKPKGVMIEHRNAASFIAAIWKSVYGRYSGHRNTALISSYIFDASVEIIFISLIFGHTLHIIPENVKIFGRTLAYYYAEHSIEIAELTPAYLSILIRTGFSPGKKINLKLLVLGGEALRYDVTNHFMNLFKDDAPTLVNTYGPTECTVTSTFYWMDSLKDKDHHGTVPIGIPLNNTWTYILDEDMKPVPQGVAGELYIGGEGIGRGYVNRQDLTAERFVHNPFVSAMTNTPPFPAPMMYRTGDIVRLLPDGNIEFIGRIDLQVKIHGYRVELGEIENKLMNFRSETFQVKEAVVVDKEDRHGDKYLIAYIVAEGEPDEAILRKHLQDDLPFYMLPAEIRKLAEIPLTSNGKTDRQALLSDRY